MDNNKKEDLIFSCLERNTMIFVNPENEFERQANGFKYKTEKEKREIAKELANRKD